MKVNYEKKQMTACYWLLVVVFLVIFGVIAWFCCDFQTGRAYCLVAILLLFFLILFCFLYKRFVAIYSNVDTISGLMEGVIEGEVDYTAEVFQQGSMGILYTNFYKMVTILRESRMKEGKEKEFLKETISDISHQLKTPLASLKVFVELLYDEKITEETKKKQVLMEAGKQLDRMEWMVLAMLKLARIEAGSIQFEKKECEVKKVLIAAVEAVEYLLDKKKQRIRILWPEGMENPQGVRMCCDKEWLTEAIINLLKNASDYSDNNTSITIRVEENHLFTRICVEDEGVGIEEADLPHIFKRFYRVNNAVNPGSVGIGLSLTKSIVEGMGGNIRVKSRVGEYTCFVLTFLK